MVRTMKVVESTQRRTPTVRPRSMARRRPVFLCLVALITAAAVAAVVWWFVVRDRESTELRDEFDSAHLAEHWTRESLAGYGVETFRPDDDLTAVDDGRLVVAAVREDDGSWTGGMVSTRRSFDMRTGQVEVRAKLPTERGAWPAIWLHNKIGGPGEADDPLAEIDIMELFPGGGSQGPGTYFTIHDWKNGDKSTELPPSRVPLDGDWHTWRVVWDDRQMELFIDDVSQGVVTPASFAEKTGGDYRVFVETDMYVIVNMAVGTSWGGPEPLPSTRRMEMQLDYVRAIRE